MIGVAWIQARDEGVVCISREISWWTADERLRRSRARTERLFSDAASGTWRRYSFNDNLVDVDLIDVTYAPYTLERPLPPCFSCSHAFDFHVLGHAPCEGAPQCACTGYDGVLFAPAINENVFCPGPLWGFADEPDVSHRTYVRRTLSLEPYELADNRRILEGGILRRTGAV